MPDWSYRPVLRPLLFRLPPDVARDRTLAAIAALAARPGGGAVIDALGHLRAPAGIGRAVLGTTVASPVGLAAGLDVGAVAPAALGRFGFGWLEVGPVAAAPSMVAPAVRDVAGGALCFPDGLPAAPAEGVVRRLTARRPPPGVRLFVRLRGPTGPSADDPAAWSADVARLAARFAAGADALVVEAPPGLAPRAVAAGDVDTSWPTVLATLRAACPPAVPLLLALPPDLPDAAADAAADAVLAAGWAGIVWGGGVAAPAGPASTACGGRHVGAPALAPTCRAVRRLRERWGPDPTVVAADGVIEPADALALLAAGADLVGLHAGLVFSGPGLPKRINEALLAAARGAAGNGATAGVAAARGAGTSPTHPRRPWWIAHALIGAVMGVAGLVAWAVAVTAVVLPYDLRWVGLTRADLGAVNPRLLDFLAHDRVSLAGTMVSLGVLYVALAWFGVRRGIHWAARAFALSTAVGLASFFLFAAHGYLDPLHAGLSITIAALFIAGRRWPAASPPDITTPDLHNDAAWRRALAGQLALVLLAVGLVGGGLTIAAIGSSRVFVATDLAFMATSADALAAANARLLPLIAHDRAGLGGALAATGLALGGLALWGIRRGARWVWWTTALAALPGLGGALGIHLAVGYVDLGHLAPVAVAAALWGFGLARSFAFLFAHGANTPNRAPMP